MWHLKIVLRYTFFLWNQKVFFDFPYLSHDHCLSLFLSTRVFQWNTQRLSSYFSFILGPVGPTEQVAYNGKRPGFRIRPSGNKIPTGTITSCVIFSSYLKYQNFSSPYIKQQYFLHLSIIVRILWDEVCRNLKEPFFSDR